MTSLQTKLAKRITRRIDIASLLMRGSLGVLLAVSLLVIFLIVFSNRFLTSTNFFATSRAFSLWAVIGFSQLFALVIGHLNLSVGAIGGLSAVTTGWLFQAYELPVWIPVLAGIAVGTSCGLLNGLLITKTGINAFVITLGTASVYTGMIFGFTHALPFSQIPSSFEYIGGGSLFGIVPILFFIMVGIAIILWLFFNYTVLGRRMLVTGGNREAARLSGINIDRVILLAHLFSGLLAGVGGVLYVARLGSAQPSIGMNWLLTSFAVPIIGGTALIGGTTSILGAVLGAVLITLISNGLVLLRVDIFWEQFFLGIILLIAVGIDRARTVYIERKYY